VQCDIITQYKQTKRTFYKLIF